MSAPQRAESSTREWSLKMKDLCELTGLPRQAVHFYIQEGLVPEGDRSYFAIDMIHPSRKASAEIGKMIAELIVSETP